MTYEPNTSKYTKTYFKIIQYYLENPPQKPIEKHHIIPKALSGNNVKTNIISLPPKAHYICHLLLTKMYDDGLAKKKMVAAYLYMAGRALKKTNLGEKRNSRLYESYRLQVSKDNSGPGNPQYGKKIPQWHKDIIAEANRGKIVSEETREKMRQNGLGRKQSEESKEKNRQWHTGIKYSEETIDKKRQKRLGQKQTDNQKQKAKEVNMKTWELTDPNGKIHIITDLKPWIKENAPELLPGMANFSSVIAGRLKHYKRWTARHLEV